MWSRIGPLCARTLYKASLQEVLRCLCGWLWGEVRDNNETHSVMPGR